MKRLLCSAWRYVYFAMMNTLKIIIIIFVLTQVLEACVKNCGQRFHQELGKFKFLNELIRLISPKVQTIVLSPQHQTIFLLSQYLGNTTSTTVKDRIKELLYSWKVGLPHEGKITEAYMMLKREGNS